MKDAQGTELQVGDTVAFTKYDRSGLSFGTVVRFTKTMIVVLRNNRQYKKTQDYVVKVKDV